MTYHHLTQEERYQVYAFRKAGFTIRAIADELRRSPSTISRELQRNVYRRGYRSQLAHRLARRRAYYSRRRLRISQQQWRGIARLLKLQWSPQQISERCQQEGTLQISHTWIYRFVVTSGHPQLFRF